MQVWPKARDAAGRAIQVAPDLAETQTSHGFVKFWLDWEWNAAEAAFRNAILLNPSYSLAHRMLGLILMHLCRHDESMAAAKRGRELDPLNMAQQALSAQVAFGARKYEAAVEFSRQAIAIDPEFWIGYMQLGQAFEQLEQPEMALSALADATRLSGGNSKPLSLRGFILARRDQTQQAHDVLRTLEMASGQKFVPPYAFALVYAGLGEQERALQFLEYAYDAHDVHLAFLTCDPKWDSFRRLERFAALLDRCGFEAKVKADTAAPDR
jgi:tetratricopeptide (TPR) repeat protein